MQSSRYIPHSKQIPLTMHSPQNKIEMEWHFSLVDQLHFIPFAIKEYCVQTSSIPVGTCKLLRFYRYLPVSINFDYIQKELASTPKKQTKVATKG